MNIDTVLLLAASGWAFAILFGIKLGAAKAMASMHRNRHATSVELLALLTMIAESKGIDIRWDDTKLYVDGELVAEVRKGAK